MFRASVFSSADFEAVVRARAELLQIHGRSLPRLLSGQVNTNPVVAVVVIAVVVVVAAVVVVV